jgi:thiol-disulfide isomerase/thioredoxin
MKTNTSWILVGLAVAAIIGGMIWYSSRPGQYDTFAGCIKESGAKFFGAFWCPHCQEQKALFGKSAKKLPYIECSTPNGQGQLEICKENKVESYPTWHFKDGTVKTGTLSLSDLAAFTGCEAVPDQN